LNGGSWSLGSETVYFYSVAGQKLGTYKIQLNVPPPGYGNPSMSFGQLETRVWFGSRLVALNGNPVVPDRLGSNGKYYPYGEDRTGAPGNDEERFATYTRDSISNLDYAMNPYYNNVSGHFLTADPRSGGSVNNPASWNRYAYAGSDPVGNMDPSGLDWCPAGAGSDICEYMEGLPSDDPGGMCVEAAWTFGFSAIDGACSGMEMGLGTVGLLAEAAMEGEMAQEPAPPPLCSIDVFTRGVPFEGSPANHTYVEISDPALGIDDVLEGGPTNPHNPVSRKRATWGNLIGYTDPIINGTITGGLKGTNPVTNRQLLSETGGADVCDNVSALLGSVMAYNAGTLVNYAPLPNGSTTFNSNSFTYTLLNQIGLSGAATTALGTWTPGWGQLVPGL